jgi:hypothetical protein
MKNKKSTRELTKYLTSNTLPKKRWGDPYLGDPQQIALNNPQTSVFNQYNGQGLTPVFGQNLNQTAPIYNPNNDIKQYTVDPTQNTRIPITSNDALNTGKTAKGSNNILSGLASSSLGLLQGASNALLTDSISAVKEARENPIMQKYSENTYRAYAMGGEVLGPPGGDTPELKSYHEAGIDGMHQLAKYGGNSSLRKLPLAGSIVSAADHIAHEDYSALFGDVLGMIPNPYTKIVSYGLSIYDDIFPGDRQKMIADMEKNRANFNKMPKEKQDSSNLKRMENNMYGSSKYALGGQVNSNIPLEAEGGEVAQTPNGENINIQGASHENGGVKMALPEGTKIYSDRIEIEGKSMADRKKARENRIAKLAILLKNKKADTATKQGVERELQFIQQQEQSDLAIQQQVGEMKKNKEMSNLQMKYGGILKKYDGGTEFLTSDIFYHGYGPDAGKKAIKFNHGSNEYIIPQGMFDVNDYNKADAAKWFSEQYYPQYIQNATTPPINTNYSKSLDGGNTWTTPSFNYSNNQKSSEFIGPTIPENYYNTDGSYNTNYNTGLNNNTTTSNLNTKTNVGLDPNITPYKETNSGGVAQSNLPFTTGENIGMAGNAVGAFSPMFTTLLNRLGDKPNPNFYKNYGTEAMKTYNSQFDYLNGVQSNQLRDLKLSENAAMNQARNSSRSVNTNRALNIAGNQVANKARNDIYNNFAESTMKLLQGKSAMQQQIEGVKAQGLAGQDLANRQDRDSFYTSMGMHGADMGKLVNNFGKTTVNNEQNNAYLNLMAQMTKHGINVDPLTGKIIFPKTK